jgi:hypothetical protein
MNCTLRFLPLPPSLHIAYRVVGNGSINVVYVPNWATSIDPMWEEHRYAVS